MLRRVRQLLLIPAFIALAGCGNGSSSSSPTVIRLVDAFKPEMVEGSAERAAARTPTEWRFTAGTAGWIAGRNVEGFGLREGRLTGRSATDFPILSVSRTRDLGNADQLHAVEIRMRVSAGSNVAFFARPAGPVDFAQAEGTGRGNPWQAVSPLLPGGEIQTYRLISPIPINMSRAHHLLVRPTDVAGSTFEIESVRMITRREHLAAVDSGMGWHGLNDIFREALVSRAPDRFDSNNVADRRPAVVERLAKALGGRRQPLPGSSQTPRPRSRSAPRNCSVSAAWVICAERRAK